MRLYHAEFDMPNKLKDFYKNTQHIVPQVAQIIGRSRDAPFLLTSA
jgi:hypothetical protein